MTHEEQTVAIAFKHDARREAIRIASRGYRTLDSGITKGDKTEADQMLEDAQKIYNWLIKDFE